MARCYLLPKMADHNANKITVQVQIEPTPGVPETSSLQPTASAEARSEARRTQSERDTSEAILPRDPRRPLTTKRDCK